MFKWAEQYVTGITFFFVSADDVVKNAESFGLDARYSVSKTVTGTRSHHSLVPVSVDEIKMRRVSADENFSYVFIGLICSSRYRVFLGVNSLQGTGERPLHPRSENAISIISTPAGNLLSKLASIIAIITRLYLSAGVFTHSPTHFRLMRQFD
ncbi:hypothetical protein GQR58_013489 [Nymphon striatum]|nr:hypothetical protein GQR58_013489 [Nymphon striatum]